MTVQQTGNALFKRTGESDFPLHLKVLISGPPKSGKTFTLRTVPHLIVLDTEPDANNLESIAQYNIPYVTIRNTQDLRQVLFLLAEPTMRKKVAAQYGWDDVEGVAIDTLDSLQKIMKRERIAEMHRSDFHKDDWGWLRTEMESMVLNFTKLPMHVFFMVHLKDKEMGKGDDSYTVPAVGLEGSIANVLPGMVGYSLLSFRQPVLQSDGSQKVEYFLRAESDGTFDFLGTRTGGRLPEIIRPDMAHIYEAVLEGRRQAIAQMPAPPPMQPMELPAQSPGQLQTPVQGPPQGQLPPAPYDAPTQPMPGGQQQVPPQQQQQQAPPQQPQQQAQPQQPTAEQAPGQPGLPADSEPINEAAFGFVQKVYSELQIPFPEDKIKALTIGDARNVVRYWKALKKDAAEGKMPEGSTAQTEMVNILQAHNLLPDAGQQMPAPAAPVEPNVRGNIDQVEAYVRNGVPNGEVDLAKVQEAYNLELTRVNGKGEPAARKSLITKLESMGAQTQQAPPPQQPPMQQHPGTGQPMPGVEHPADGTMSPPIQQPVQQQPVQQQQVQPQFQAPVQTPVQTQQQPPQGPPQGVTPQAPPADASSTGGIGVAGGETTMTQAVENLQSGLGGQVIAEGITPGAPCAQCGKPHDDADIAKLAQVRFGKILCVQDYTAAISTPSN